MSPASGVHRSILNTKASLLRVVPYRRIGNKKYPNHPNGQGISDVEPAGIEPASRKGNDGPSTCLVTAFDLGLWTGGQQPIQKPSYLNLTFG